MEDYKLNKFKQILLQEKENLMNIIENRSANVGLEGVTNYPEDDLSTIDNHPAEIGTEVFMRQQDEGFKATYKDRLEEVESAITRINNGSYGFCKTCGRQIYEERLEAIPYTFHCHNCTGTVDSDEKIYESLEKEYINKRGGGRDNVHFDREDTYQALAEYEKIPKDPSNSTGDYMGVMDDEDTNVESVENISQEYYDETQD